AADAADVVEAPAFEPGICRISVVGCDRPLAACGDVDADRQCEQHPHRDGSDRMTIEMEHLLECRPLLFGHTSQGDLQSAEFGFRHDGRRMAMRVSALPCEESRNSAIRLGNT